MFERRYLVKMYHVADQEVAASQIKRNGDFTVFSDECGTVARIRSADIERVDRLPE
jgi:hypothetical protein